MSQKAGSVSFTPIVGRQDQMTVFFFFYDWQGWSSCSLSYSLLMKLSVMVSARVSRNINQYSDLAPEALKCARQYLIWLTRKVLVVLTHFGHFCSESLVKSAHHHPHYYHSTRTIYIKACWSTPTLTPYLSLHDSHWWIGSHPKAHRWWWSNLWQKWSNTLRHWDQNWWE